MGMGWGWYAMVCHGFFSDGMGTGWYGDGMGMGKGMRTFLILRYDDHI